MRAETISGWLAVAFLTGACGGTGQSVAPQRPIGVPASATAAPPAPADPLGPPPQQKLGAPFQPPAPVVYTTPNGITVWLLERHTLPVVAVSACIPSGASSDPKGQAGVAQVTAEMLGEGAGKRGALDFEKAVDELGASLTTTAGRDASYVQLSVVRRNFGPSMQLLGDAITRPRMDPNEWKRVHDLWMNGLKERASEPSDVARVVEATVLYGADHPYGHPVDGLLATAPKVHLEDVKRFYAQAWRPDRTFLVAVGDVTKAELDAQLDAAFGTWKSPATAPLPIVTPPPPAAENGGAKAKLVFVDRADAPQAEVDVIRPGVTASDPRYPPLYRANIAIGGTFTSRINQDLREKHGWTYGAGSRVSAQRGVGAVRAGGAFITDKTVEALKALLADLDDFTRVGMTEDEAAKTRVQARSDVLDEYQTVQRASMELARNAALGLGPDYEAKSSVLADQADRRELNKLASTFFDRSAATIVIVGPRAKLEEQLLQAGFGPIEYRDTEGNVIKGTK